MITEPPEHQPLHNSQVSAQPLQLGFPPCLTLPQPGVLLPQPRVLRRQLLS